MGLVFAGQDFAEYGVIIDSASSWPKPERDVEVIHVPGRNGDLIIDNGCWKNVEITYNCLIKDGWQEKFDDFCDMLYELHGYYELFDDAHPGVKRMAAFAGPVDPELWFTTDTGVFELTFDCKPLQYISPNDGIFLDFTAADAESSIDNPYKMFALPGIRVDSQTGAKIEIGPWTVKIAAQTQYSGVYIDCENELCYGIDEMGNYLGNAMQYLTVIPPENEWQNPDDREFPVIPYGVGIHLKALHEDIEEGVVVATYTGTATITPNLVRI